jgi:hypothetical protein
MGEYFILIIAGVVCALLMVMAVFLLNGKGVFLLSGFNRMNPLEKLKYDPIALCRFSGGLMIAIAFLWAVMSLGLHFDITWLYLTAVILVPIVAIGGEIFTKVSRIFRIDKAAPTGGLASLSRATRVGLVIVVLCYVGVGVPLAYGVREPAVILHSDHLQITGMYGTSVEFNEINSISIVHQPIGELGAFYRTNGIAGLGQTLKGHFVSHERGAALLFVQADASPLLIIERNGDKHIYLSFKDAAFTQTLYNELKEIIP